jgi:preprotein translocase subunit SecD
LSKATREAVNQSIEVINRRVNPTGARNITVTLEAEHIVLRTPPSFDSDVVRRRIGSTALMTFHLLREDANIEEAAAGRAPLGAVLMQFAESSGQQGGLVVERRPRLTGENLTNAQAGFDQMTNRPVVTFQLDASGARAFCTVTTANVGKQFAVVLDDRVLTAPVIQEPICGGNGQITGSFTPEETQELALLLRAGALPTPLRIVEQRTVGAP